MTALRDDERPGFVARESRAPLVGRLAILEAMEGERVVLLRGEPGGGKSRILAEARSRATDSIVVSVRCHKGVVSTHEPLEAAIAAAVRAAGAERRSVSRDGSDTDRLLAIRERLEYLASSRSLLVQIDDLHFAPVATVAAIAFCVDRTRDSAIRWQLATRPAARNDVELDSMRRDDDCVVIDVPALDEAETGQLALALGGEPSPDVHRLTGGNPLYIEQWLASRRRPEAALTLRATLDARLAELASDETALAAFLAVANRPLSRTAAASLGTPIDDIRSIVARLAAAGIVHADGEWFEFVHDLLRDASYDAIESARRREIHQSLLEISGNLGERAFHLQGAGRVADAIACYLAQVRDALSNFSFTEAAAIADRIASLRPIARDVAWQLDATRVVIETATSGYPADLRGWRQLIADGAPVDPDTRAFFYERMVGVIARPSDPAAQLCIDTVANDPSIGTEMRGMFATWQLRVHYSNLDDAAALGVADRALTDVDPASDVAFQLRSLRAMVQGVSDPDGAHAEFRKLIDDPKNRALPSYAFGYLCAANLEDRRSDDAAVYAIAKIGAQVGGVREQRGLYAHWASAALLLGHTAEALEVCTGARTRAIARGGLPTVSNATLHIQTLVWRDDLERARMLLDRTLASGVSPDDQARLDFGAAMLLEARGEIANARETYATAAGNLEESTDNSDAAGCAALVRFAVADGDGERARYELARLHHAATRGTFALRYHAEAAFYLTSSTGDDAATRAAFAHASACGMAVLPRAVALARLGERLRDRNAMLEAIAIFDTAEAVAFAERTRSAARALGFRPGGKPVTRQALSERETDVVQAIAEGKTNREIAGDLHISPKTVAACVSAVLLKCGLRSRVEIAALVASGKAFVRVEG